MLRRACLPFLLAATGAGAGAAEVPAQLKACGDAGEYPPFTYYQRKDGVRTATVAGVNAAHLQSTLAAQGRTVDIRLLPWKRCLAETQAGKFDFLLDSTGNQARRRQFLVSTPYASLTRVLLYRSSHPLPQPRSWSDLVALRRCEMLGWDNYIASAPSGTTSQPSSLELGLAMLSAGRCEGMISHLEVIHSLDLVGGADWANDLSYHYAPMDQPSTLHYGVSRGLPYARELLALLDDGIRRRQDGAGGSAMAPQALKACGDAAGYAPYTYAAAGGRASGYNVDYLQALLARTGRSVRVDLLPWKRCLLLAAQGKYDLILDAADLPDRRRDFILPASHYTATPVFVYLAGREPPRLASKLELSAQRRCQITGWDYSRSGSRARPELIVYASNAQAALTMLRHGRCSLLHYQLELLRGVEETQGSASVAGLRHRMVPWAPAASMHYGVSRKLPYAKPLAALLDEGTARMARSGEAARLLQRHLPR